jgi:integrase
MARFEKDPNGNLRIAFTLDGRRFRVPPEGGQFADTKANRSFLNQAVLKPLKRFVAAGDRAAILRLFPSSKALRRSDLMGQAGSGTRLVTELFQLLYDDYAAEERKSTGKSLDTRFRRPRQWFKGMLACDCTSEVLLRYRDQRKAEVSPKTHRVVTKATVNRELSAVVSAFKRAKERGLVAGVPEVRQFSEKGNERQGYFTYDEYLAVLGRFPDYMHAMLTTYYVTGWRKSEVLLKLGRQSLDLKRGRMRIETSKNGEPREIALPGELREVLTGHVAWLEGLEARSGWKFDYLWVRPDGSRIKSFRHRFETAVARALEAGELRGRKLLHDFRRTAVRNLEWSQVPQGAGMKFTGHKSAVVYARYAVQDSASSEWTAERLGEHMAKHGMGLGRENLPNPSPIPGPYGGGVPKTVEIQGVTEQKPHRATDFVTKTTS